jgi:hypothetical protein
LAVAFDASRLGGNVAAAYPRATTIGLGWDLNTMIDPGLYMTTSNANTSALLNKPFEVATGMVTVVVSASGTGVNRSINQKFTHWFASDGGTQYRIFERTIYTFAPDVRIGGWVEVLTTLAGVSFYGALTPINNSLLETIHALPNNSYHFTINASTLTDSPTQSASAYVEVLTTRSTNRKIVRITDTIAANAPTFQRNLTTSTTVAWAWLGNWSILPTGIGGTYTQGTHFDGAGLPTFQQWLDANVNNRIFDGNLVINLSQDNATNVFISNVQTARLQHGITINSTAQLAPTLQLFNIDTVITLNLNAPLSCNNISAHNCHQITMTGQTTIGSMNMNDIRRLVLSNSATSNLTVTGELGIGFGTNIFLSNASAATTVGSLFLSGVLRINTGVNFTIQGSINTLNGQVIDNRTGRPLETFQRKLPPPPATGTVTLLSVDGVLQWV